MAGSKRKHVGPPLSGPGDCEASDIAQQRQPASAHGELSGDSDEGLVALYGLQRDRHVLTVGEGNLSFAAALAKLGAGCRLVATTYESAEEHAERFPGAAAVQEQLRCAGVIVAHGVDAANLLGTLPDALRQDLFDSIIFQFPQHPERRKIQRQRELLRSFLRSAATKLAPCGAVMVSLCQGQGGTPAEAAPKRPADTWQIQEAAAEAGLLLRLVQACPMRTLTSLGYSPTGFRGAGVHTSTASFYQDRPFNSEGSLTHVLCRDDVGVASPYPLEWQTDISFWIDETFQERGLEQILHERCGPGIDVSLVLLDDYCHPVHGRRARTYRLVGRTATRALTSRVWKELCESVRQHYAQDDATTAKQPVESSEVGDAGRCDVEEKLNVLGTGIPLRARFSSEFKGPRFFQRCA